MLAALTAAAGQGTAVLAAVESFAVLLAVAALVAMAARRINVPYSVALVLVGLVVSSLRPRVDIEVSPELVLVVLLPGLVFEASYQMDLTQLRRSFGWVVVLATPGVILSAAIVAAVLHLAAGLPLDIAFVVGAIVAATDPVAVLATFDRLRAPARLRTLVEAESLFNDGTAIVVFTLALAAIGQPIQIGEGIGRFFGIVAGSVIVGAVAGFVASEFVAQVDDHLIEITISVLVAYGTYLVADGLGASGLIATVTAGVVFGSYGRRFGLTRRAQEGLDIVWEFVAFILNALAFLLIGAATSLGDIGVALPAIAWGVVAIVVARAIVVYGLLGLPARIVHLRRGTEPIPVPWLHVVFWAGLRGAVATALALSLPADFPQRAMVQGIVFGIVLFTLLVQGTTADLVLRRTGVSGSTDAEQSPGDRLG